MRILTVVAVAAVFALQGCVTSGQMSKDDVRTLLSDGKGLVVMGFDMPDEATATFWGASALRLDPATGLPEKEAPDRRGSNVAGFFMQTYRVPNFERRFASTLVEPGEYAITAIGLRNPSGGAYYTPGYGGGGDMNPAAAAASGGLIGLAMVAGIEAARAAGDAAEDREFGAPPPAPLLFYQDGVLSEDAPRFTVAAGEVVYIGDFLYGAERYAFEQTIEGSGPNSTDRAEVLTLNMDSPFLEYTVSTDAAKRRMVEVGADIYPFRTVTLRQLARGRIEMAPRMTRERLLWRSEHPLIEEKTLISRPAQARPLSIVPSS